MWPGRPTVELDHHALTLTKSSFVCNNIDCSEGLSSQPTLQNIKLFVDEVIWQKAYNSLFPTIWVKGDFGSRKYFAFFISPPSNVSLALLWSSDYKVTCFYIIYLPIWHADWRIRAAFPRFSSCVPFDVFYDQQLPSSALSGFCSAVPNEDMKLNNSVWCLFGTHSRWFCGWEMLKIYSLFRGW